ncbi:MAG: hypothetical protein JO189_32400 [Deltaproteobacteria bacterium]|nr:hypothetical protein [Deltaproteobacteria bacterium]
MLKVNGQRFLQESRTVPMSNGLIHGSVRGNKRSHIYQWPGCSSYDKISEQYRVEFPSAQAAEAAGYRPAHNCP